MGLDIESLLISALAVIIGIVIHESAHALAAYALGDKTARSRGRVSLNPLKHIDPFGTILLPLLMIAAGGPVFAFAELGSDLSGQPQASQARRAFDLAGGARFQHRVGVPGRAVALRRGKRVGMGHGRRFHWCGVRAHVYLRKPVLGVFQPYSASPAGWLLHLGSVSQGRGAQHLLPHPTIRHAHLDRGALPAAHAHGYRPHRYLLRFHGVSR